MAEHFIRNEAVAGSIPITSSTRGITQVIPHSIIIRGYVVSVINKGESILCTHSDSGNKTYEDLTDVVKELDEEDGGIYAYDNFAIKGYANPILKTPSKTKITSLKAGKGKAKLSWKKVKSASGYQIEYKKAGAKKWKKIDAGKKTTKTIKKLKTNKSYKFKVRAYIKYEDATKYSFWSKIWAVRGKK